MEKVKAVAGIDIGGTSTTFGFVDRSGKILAGGQIITSRYDKPDDFVAALYEKMMITAQNSGYDIEIPGFGIGAPMGNINRGTIEHAANLPWKGIVPLADLFARHTPLPVIVTNDANAAAVGEMIFGGARGMKNFVVITLGTGLGSGFVVDGKLVYGHDGFAGELGHITIKTGRSDRECGCGRKGCLETYVSATGLKRTVLQLMADRLDDSELRKLSFGELDSKLICEAARRGDPIALEAFEHTGAMLGFSLANVTVHTNPEAIFLFGGLALAGELIFEPVRRHLEENILYIYRGKVKLLPSELSTQNAAVLGASSLVWFEQERV